MPPIDWVKMHRSKNKWSLKATFDILLHMRSNKPFNTWSDEILYPHCLIIIGDSEITAKISQKSYLLISTWQLLHSLLVERIIGTPTAQSHNRDHMKQLQWWNSSLIQRATQQFVLKSASPIWNPPSRLGSSRITSDEIGQVLRSELVRLCYEGWGENWEGWLIIALSHIETFHVALPSPHEAIWKCSRVWMRNKSSIWTFDRMHWMKLS